MCQGNTLTPFINGVQMRIWQENKFGLKEGKIGISAASFADVPFTTAYDWVKVSRAVDPNTALVRYFSAQDGGKVRKP